MISTSHLLDALRHGPLVPPEHLTEAEQLTASLPHPDAVIAELVRRGWLTLYQAVELRGYRGYALVVAPYVLLERLGAGGMGEVFRAVRYDKAEQVALKRMLPALLSAPGAIQRFAREVRAAARLSHPNVVKVLDSGEVNGIHYLTMELLCGVNLSVHAQRHGLLPVAEAIDYVRQACEGMQHAHEKGLVHRDLKPSNMMRTAEGQIKILDLGLALVPEVSSLTQTRDFLGTPDYVAPEQVSDPHRVDIRADVYSLGCTLYRLLAGRTPFADAAPDFRHVMHLSQDPPPIEDLRPDLRPEVVEVVRKMMARRPEQRFGTPGEVATALAALLARQPSAPPPRAFPLPATTGPAQTAVLPDSAEVPPSVLSGKTPRPFTNTIGMTFVLIPSGTFLMGSPPTEWQRSDDERQHEVTITKAFYLGVHPVTQGQWKAVLGRNPSYFSFNGGGRDKVRNLADLDDYPVETVSWLDVQEFLRALGEMPAEKDSGRVYRLPTEAEWEYACRGGADPKYPFAFGRPSLSICHGQANFDSKYPYGSGPGGPSLERTSKVGIYEANPFGVYGMHGNVREWCSDWHGLYEAGPVSDPQGPASGSARTLRGGSWASEGKGCRAGQRRWARPEERSYLLGFRVVVVPPSL